ncbi:unnamed protein product, partial [Nesidiocoris tenuis]
MHQNYSRRASSLLPNLKFRVGNNLIFFCKNHALLPYHKKPTWSQPSSLSTLSMMNGIRSRLLK